MNEHTKGRLTARDFMDSSDLEQEDGIAIGVCFSSSDCRRLAACWNACKGMPIEHIEALQGIGTIGDLSSATTSEIIELRRQFDAARHLLELANGIFDGILYLQSNTGCETPSPSLTSFNYKISVFLAAHP